RDAASRCVVVAKDAPVLRPADVTLLAMTNPRPHPDPFLPPFLHGEVQAETDVAIVWRADCEVIASSAGAEAAKRIVACQPPVTGEALRVPIWAARSWLSRPSRDAAEISDAEAEREPEHETQQSSRSALRWRGLDSDETGLIAASALRPGDLIVVPSSYGGCDRFGWAPDNAAPTQDVADDAAQPYTARRFSLRLHSALWGASDSMRWETAWSQVQELAGERDQADVICVLNQMPDLPSHVRSAVTRLASQPTARRIRIECPYDDNDRPSGAVLIAPRGVTEQDDGAERSGAASTEDDGAGSFPGRAVPLAAHAKAVADQAAIFAAALRLPVRLATTLAFAARHHDDGKADPRFQAWLTGPDIGDEVLAKSERWRGLAAEQAARTAAGVPRQWRHEVLSVRIAAQLLGATGDDMDQALALYLIGSHHGYGRPFFPHHDPWDAQARLVLDVMVAAGAGPERLDFDWHGCDWAELFAGLQAQYGPWGLAFLEAVLRLADHRASERTR
ncbi:MAG TPA: HD domain-containing protein, partial [Acetobacteraceae bacterium]|nr:HD domain-containing protein [Acetobacteraceae bacterium]